MQNKVLYEHAVIRYVPQVEREEFINIGVIVLCKAKNYLQLKYTVDDRKIKAISPDADVDMISEYLEAWSKVCDGENEGGKIGTLEIRLRFRWLTASRSTILQSSKVHPGKCKNPQNVLDKLFQKYVV